MVDRLGASVMDGFSRIPRRGAEIGGILLGSIRDADRPLVHIVDFLPVPVDYRWGPSYQFSEEDLERFDSALEGVKKIPGRDVYAVGYFRSHTRETFHMVPEDVQLMDSHFPHPSAVCLLIRPHRTQASSAAFLFRRDGKFNTEPLSTVLPFRRNALGGGRVERRRDRRAFQTAFPRASPPASLSTPGAAEPVPAAPSFPAPASPASAAPEPPVTQTREPEPAWVPRFGGLVTDADLMTAEEREAKTRVRRIAGPRRRWIAISYSIVMLLLGLLSGAWLAQHYLPTLAAPPDEARLLPLSLDVQKADDEIALSWSLSPALERQATGGTLRLIDGVNEKAVELSRADILRRGLRFRPQAGESRMKLEIRIGLDSSVSESAVWTATQGSAGTQSARNDPVQ